jgi:hypothetical protein
MGMLIQICIQFHLLEGCAIAQVVSRWLPTVAAQVQSCGICGGQVALGQVSSEYFGFPCQFSFRLLRTHHHHHL